MNDVHKMPNRRIPMHSQYPKGSRHGDWIRSTLAAAALSVACVTVQLAPAFAQSADVSTVKLAREGYTLTKDGAEEIEALLRNKPDDLTARTRLLGFYF